MMLWCVPASIATGQALNRTFCIFAFCILHTLQSFILIRWSWTVELLNRFVKPLQTSPTWIFTSNLASLDLISNLASLDLTSESPARPVCTYLPGFHSPGAPYLCVPLCWAVCKQDRSESETQVRRELPTQLRGKQTRARTGTVPLPWGNTKLSILPHTQS